MLGGRGKCYGGGLSLRGLPFYGVWERRVLVERMKLGELRSAWKQGGGQNPNPKFRFVLRSPFSRRLFSQSNTPLFTSIRPACQ